MNFAGQNYLSSIFPGYQQGQANAARIQQQQLANQDAIDARRASLAALIDSSGVDPTTATIMALSGGNQPATSFNTATPPQPANAPVTTPNASGVPTPTATPPGGGPSLSPMAPQPASATPTAAATPQGMAPPFMGGQMSLGQMLRRLKADPKNQGIPDVTLLGLAAKAQSILHPDDRLLLQYMMNQQKFNQPTAAENIAHQDRQAALAASVENRDATNTLRKQLFEEGLNQKEASKWTVYTDPQTNKQYRFNTQTGQATTLDGKEPYTPSGAQKLQGGSYRSAPALAAQRYIQEHPNATAEDVANFGAEYASRVSSARGFSAGQQGNQVRSINVAVQHLDIARQAADALANGDVRMFNAAKQKWDQAVGSPLPTNFDSIKQIVGQEITKSIIAGGGGVTERQAAGELLSRANSPQQLAGAIDEIQKLMAGQLNGLRKQYESGTRLDDFDQRFLMPETMKVMKRSGYEGKSSGGEDQSQPTVSNW